VLRLGSYFDLPQIGAVAVAIGSYLLAIERFPGIARELLALAPRVGARQDMPPMRIERHLALHGPATAEEAMAEVRQHAARLGRRSAGRRIMELLRDLPGKVGQ
jgi:hypothetical protein